MDIVNEDRINEEKVYREAFDDLDWNKSGTIPNSVSRTHLMDKLHPSFSNLKLVKLFF